MPGRAGLTSGAARIGACATVRTDGRGWTAARHPRPAAHTGRAVQKMRDAIGLQPATKPAHSPPAAGPTSLLQLTLAPSALEGVDVEEGGESLAAVPAAPSNRTSSHESLAPAEG